MSNKGGQGQEATGNVWIDPDTGKPSNPHNVQTEDLAIPTEDKYGPAVLGDPDVAEEPREQKTEAEEAARLTTEGQEAQPQEALVDVTDEFMQTTRYGTAFEEEEDAVETPPPEEDEAELQQIIQVMRTLNTQRKSDDKNVAATAERTPEGIAAAEYARPGGGRSGVTKRLASFGIKKPR